MEFFADSHKQFREPSVIQCSVVTGTSPEPTCFLTPLIPRTERVTNVPTYWLLLLQVQAGVGGDSVQNQGVLGGSKAELSLYKDSHFRVVLAPGKYLIHDLSKGPLGRNDWGSYHGNH